MSSRRNESDDMVFRQGLASTTLLTEDAKDLEMVSVTRQPKNRQLGAARPEEIVSDEFRARRKQNQA